MARLASLFLLMFAASSGAGHAQQFPARHITLIDNFPPGNVASVVVRMMNENAARALGQPIIMETRARGRGRLGLQAVREARGDPYLLTVATEANAVTLPLLDSTFHIEPGRDYTPVFLSHEIPFILVANRSLGVPDARGMVAYANAHFATTTFGLPGLAGMAHLSTELLMDRARFDARVNAYRGEPQAAMALVSGEVQFMLASGYIKSFIKSGKVVGLATTGAARSPFLPDLPTLREMGVADFVAVSWYGFVAPPDVPADAVRQLNAAYLAARAMPAVAAKMRDLGFTPAQDPTPEEFGAMIRSELLLFAPVVKKVGIKLG